MNTEVIPPLPESVKQQFGMRLTINNVQLIQDQVMTSLKGSRTMTEDIESELLNLEERIELNDMAGVQISLAKIVIHCLDIGSQFRVDVEVGLAAELSQLIELMKKERKDD